MQTAVGEFGGEGYADGLEVPPLMVANTGDSGRPAFSSLNSPPFVTVELCRERWEFTGVIREETSASISRSFLLLISHRLWTRKEKEIAVVSHNGFLTHTFAAFGDDCHPSVKGEICRSFNNCELRSMIIVDKRMSGSDSSTTDYTGKLPEGSDAPNDDDNVIND